MLAAPPRLSRRRATVLNLGLQYLNVALLVAQGILVVPLFLSRVPSHVYGAWLASGNVVGWLMLVDPGVTAVLQQRVGKAYGAGEHARLGAIAGTGLAVSMLIAVLLASGGWAVSPFVPDLVRLEDPVGARAISNAFALATAAEGVFLVATAVSAILMALMIDLPLAGLAYAVATMIGIATTIVGVVGGGGVLAIPFGYAVRAALLLCFNMLLLRRVLVLKLGVRLSVDRTEWREVFQLSVFTWLSRLSGAVAGQVDALLLARLAGPGAVPAYVLTKRAAELCTQITTRFSAAFIPALAHAQGAGQIALVRDMSLRLLRVVCWLSSGLLGGYVALNRSFVDLWVGPAMFGGQTLTVLVGALVVAQNVAGVAIAVLTAGGRIREISIYQFIDAVVRAALSAALLLWLGVPWALPLAALVAAFVGVPTLLAPRFAAVLDLPRRAALAAVAELLRDAALPLLVGALFAQLVSPPVGVSGFIAAGCAVVGAELLALSVASRAFRSELAGVVRKLRTHWVASP